MQIREAQLAQTVLDALQKQVPVKDPPGVRIAQVRQEPERPFDLSFELTSVRRERESLAARPRGNRLAG